MKSDPLELEAQLRATLKKVEELESANRELKELAAMKDEFVANVSHELRNPLTAVKEGVSLLLDGALGSMNAEQRDFLETVAENIDRMAELVNNVLDLAKIEAGRLRLRRRRVDIGELIETTLHSYRTIAGKRTLQGPGAAAVIGRPALRDISGQKLQGSPALRDISGQKLQGSRSPTASSGVAVPPVYLDSNRILQVLGNLFSNAVKFTREDGTIYFSLEERDGQVAVSVYDDGEGITPEDIPKLFKKFSQVGKAAQGRKGTGLGLVLCKELVEMHGGSLSVTSNPGKGSVFTFTVPIYTSRYALEESFRDLVESVREGEREGTVGLIALDVGDSTKPLQKIMEFIRGQLHRDDTVLSVEPSWVVILVVTDADGLETILQRIRKNLREQAQELGFLAGKTLMNMATALYPVDGADVHELFARATYRIRQRFVRGDSR